MRPRGLLWLVLPMVFVLLLAACVDDEEEVAEEEEPDDDEEEVVEDDEPDDEDEEEPEDEPAGFQYLERAEDGEFEGEEVLVLSQWIDAEGEAFQNALVDFADRTGIDLQVDGVTDYETVLSVRVEGGDPPDIAQLAQPGLKEDFAADGHLVDLSEWMDVDALNERYDDMWLDMSTIDDGLYSVWYRANAKSIVWYPVEAFEEGGYETPETWDELLALSDQIIADGNGNPWCVAQEHDDATGWVLTDWVEDVLLRTADHDIYDGWITGEVPFDHPDIVAAAERAGQDILFAEDYVYGGSTRINATWVGDAQTPMFAEDGPDCWLHKQAGWIPDFWPDDPETGEPFVPGEDSAFFYLPPIEEEYGEPVLGSGDFFMQFDDREVVRAVMEYLATAEAAQGWIEEGGLISPNNDVPLDWYEAYTDREIARIIDEATSFHFDASDMMPAEVGTGSFWEGMIDWAAADGENTEEVFSQIAETWPDDE